MDSCHSNITIRLAIVVDNPGRRQQSLTTISAAAVNGKTNRILRGTLGRKSLKNIAQVFCTFFPTFLVFSLKALLYIYKFQCTASLSL